MKYIAVTCLAISGFLLIATPFIYCYFSGESLNRVEGELPTYFAFVGGFVSLYFANKVAQTSEAARN